MGIQDLMALSAQKAHQINVLLPPVNAPALILRLSQELAIPQVHYAKALCRKSVCRSCVQELSHKSTRCVKAS